MILPGHRTRKDVVVTVLLVLFSIVAPPVSWVVFLTPLVSWVIFLALLAGFVAWGCYLRLRGELPERPDKPAVQVTNFHRMR